MIKNFDKDDARCMCKVEIQHLETGHVNRSKGEVSKYYCVTKKYIYNTHCQVTAYIVSKQHYT